MKCTQLSFVLYLHESWRPTARQQPAGLTDSCRGKRRGNVTRRNKDIWRSRRLECSRERERLTFLDVCVRHRGRRSACACERKKALTSSQLRRFNNTVFLYSYSLSMLKSLEQSVTILSLLIFEFVPVFNLPARESETHPFLLSYLSASASSGNSEVEGLYFIISKTEKWD